jgi:LysR family transcriptional regulator, glycine cleavage system transcriptional activator
MERLPSMQTLQAFEAAARHGSYSDAAAELNVTHGAISHRIRELELRLKVRLFQRSGRSMVPTREAVTLLAQVRQSMLLLQSAFPERAKRNQSKLVVGVHPALATRWLVSRLGRFTTAYPKITLEVRSTADLGDFLAPGINVAIRYGAGTWVNVVSEWMANEVLFPVCTPEYRRRLRIERPADLARCTLLRHTWQPWSPWLRASGLTLREPATGLALSDSAMLLEAAGAGQGVALARSVFALDDLDSGKLVRLFDIEVSDPNAYFVVSRAGETITPAAHDFRDWLRAEMSAETIASSRMIGVPQPAREPSPTRGRANRNQAADAGHTNR